MKEPNKLIRAAAGSLTAASVRKASPLAFPTYFSDALANKKMWRFGDSFWRQPWYALSEHGTCFVEGAAMLDDVSFTPSVAYISQATLDSERHWTPLEIGTGNIGLTPKRVGGYCGEQSSAYPPATRRRRTLAK